MLVSLKALIAFDSMNIDSGSETISLVKAGSQLLEWTDERTLLLYLKVNIRPPETLQYFHVKIVTEGLELASSESASFRKAICQILGKTFLPPSQSIHLLNLKQAALEITSSDEKIDVVSSRALEKFLSRLDAIK